MHEPTDNLKCRIRTPAAAIRWIAEIDQQTPATVSAEIEEALLYYETARLNAAIYYKTPLANIRFWNELDERQQSMIRVGFGCIATESYVYRLCYDGQTITHRRTL